MSRCIKLICLLIFGVSATLKAQEPVHNDLPLLSAGMQLPDSSYLLNVAGDTVYFSTLKGEWLLLDYWSASCRPCIEEMPYLRELSRMPGKGFRLLMINTDKSRKKWLRGIKRFNPPAVNYTLDRSIDNALLKLNLVWLKAKDGTRHLSTHMPQYALVAPDGTIVKMEMMKPSSPEFFKALKRYQRKF